MTGCGPGPSTGWEQRVYDTLLRAYGETCGGLDLHQLTVLTGIPHMALCAILMGLQHECRVVGLAVDGKPRRIVYHVAKSPSHFVADRIKRESR